jgi:hypothetical protein
MNERRLHGPGLDWTGLDVGLGRFLLAHSDSESVSRQSFTGTAQARFVIAFSMVYLWTSYKGESRLLILVYYRVCMPESP